MESPTLNLLIGAGIALLSSLITQIVAYILDRIKEKDKRAYNERIRAEEVKEKRRSAILDTSGLSLNQSSGELTTLSQKREDLKKKLLEGKRIIIPTGKLACFAEETLISIDSSNKRKICDLKKNDLILTKNLINGSIEKQKISKIISSRSSNNLIIINNILTITNEHQLVIKNKPKKASQLTLIDTLETITNNEKEIFKLEKIKREIDVYNIAFEENHYGFYAEEILVGDYISKTSIQENEND